MYSALRQHPNEILTILEEVSKEFYQQSIDHHVDLKSFPEIQV